MVLIVIEEAADLYVGRTFLHDIHEYIQDLLVFKEDGLIRIVLPKFLSEIRMIHFENEEI